MIDTSLIATALSKALDLWTKPVLRFGIEDGKPTVELFPERTDRASVDERIQKIDAAKHNLSEALDTIHELKVAAEQNKAELSVALERLNDAKLQQMTAERELTAVRDIARSDIEVFQRLAGVPSRKQIAKERFIGFLLGITASIVAAGLWTLGEWLWQRLWPVA